MSAKKTKGRQKIEMKRVENEEDRMITFSKRKSGVYKKLNELAALCGAEVGFLAFSGAGTPFTFGHPSFEEVANRLLNQNEERRRDNAQILTDAHSRQRINALNQRYEELVDMLEGEKQREKGIKHMMAEGEGSEEGWWRVAVNELNDVKELKRMHGAFEALHDALCNKIKERSQQFGASASSSSQANMFVSNNTNEEADPSSRRSFG